ncbi:MAG: hypothetical protein IPM92_11850 [Saprospiraceae bacterium]|nr:hypothetical protein [Saprospiraceae bacterium]
MWRNIFIISLSIQYLPIEAQYTRADYNWLIGSDQFNDVNKIQIIFNDLGLDRIIGIQADEKNRIPANYSNTAVSNSKGELRVFSTGCYIANEKYDTLRGSHNLISKRKLDYCRSWVGWPIDQSDLLLPWPDLEGSYKLFYTNWGNPYINFDEDSLMLFPSFSEALFSCNIHTDTQNEIFLESCWDTVLADTVCESYITACYQDNIKDWWIVNPRAGSNCYFVFVFNHEGVKVYSKQCIGPFVGRKDNFGQAKFSPNRNKYARFNGTQLILLDFNPSDGSFSNPIELRNSVNDSINTRGGIAFSSNSRYLYAFNITKVYQYDLFEPDVKGSEILIRDSYIDTLAGIHVNYHHGLLAPDGRIYISEMWWSNKLSVIESPNCKGTLCNFKPGEISLPGLNFFNLPNLPTYRVWDDSDVCLVNSSNENKSEYGNFYILDLNNYILRRNYKYDGFTDYKMKIIDIEGRLMKQFHGMPDNIALDPIKGGIYFILLESEGKTMFQKILIL